MPRQSIPEKMALGEVDGFVVSLTYHVSSLAIVLSSFTVGDHTVYSSDSTGQGGQ